MNETSVQIWIPDGYMAMPLQDIDQRMAVVQDLIGEQPESDLKSTAMEFIPAATALFAGLAERDARYCGVGRHLSSSGSVVTSCITVCVYETGGEQTNPRVRLMDLVDSRNKYGDVWDSEPMDVDGRPMMFSERTVTLPVPDISGVPHAGGTAETYQLEAVVPSSDGTSIASIEFSTAFVDHGPDFQKMIFDMARSIEFEPSSRAENRPSSLNL